MLSSTLHPSFADLDIRLAEIEEQGYTIFPGWLERGFTAELRAHIDAVAGPVGKTGKPRNDLRHPIPGEIMGRLAANPATIELGRLLLGGDPELRMREQVLIRSDPEPPPYAPELGYHIDAAFCRAEFVAVPKQVYYQMLHYLSRVQPGGAGVHIVPGSHRFSYAALFGDNPGRDTAPLDSNTSGAGHRDDGVEICAGEGDLILFNPLCFHSASQNRTDRPRYVYFTSFYDTSAARLIEFVRRTGYRDQFPDSLRQALPPGLRPLLAR